MTFKEPYDQYIGKKIVLANEDTGVKLRGIIVKVVTHGDNTLIFYMIRLSASETVLSIGRIVLTKNKLGEYEDSDVSIREASQMNRHLAIEGVFEIPKLAETRL